MNKKIMQYWMHVDWNWIKQRPHFLAEELSEFFDMHVCYGKSFHKKKNLVKNANSRGLKLNAVLRLPMIAYQFGLIRLAAGIINYFAGYRKMKKADVVLTGHPVYYPEMKLFLGRSQFLVYDCMDDILEFPGLRERKKLYQYLLEAEKQLCGRADRIVASSQNLKNKLSERYQIKPDRITVVNNGFNLSHRAGDPQTAPAVPAGLSHNLVYIGTISEWVDFPLVLRALDTYPTIQAHFYGPVAPGVAVPQHERLFFHGPVPHAEIFGIMKNAGALCMPFVVNELILSVNPVKLYEYIYAGKPAVSVYYPETEKFEEYVHLYRSGAEWMDLMGKLADGTLKAKRSESDSVEFAMANTWKSRAHTIHQLLQQ